MIWTVTTDAAIIPGHNCGFNRPMQQVREIVERVFRSLVSSSDVRWAAELSR